MLCHHFDIELFGAIFMAFFELDFLEKECEGKAQTNAQRTFL